MFETWFSVIPSTITNTHPLALFLCPLSTTLPFLPLFTFLFSMIPRSTTPLNGISPLTPTGDGADEAGEILRFGIRRGNDNNKNKKQNETTKTKKHRNINKKKFKKIKKSKQYAAGNVDAAVDVDVRTTVVICRESVVDTHPGKQQKCRQNKPTPTRTTNKK